MTTTRMPWGAAIRKELRALAPIWAAGVVVMVAGTMAANAWRTANLFNIAFLIGALALGAMAFGHEYLHGTLAGWLAQPASRSRLAGAKFAALLVTITSYVAVAAVTVAASAGRFAPGLEWLLVIAAVYAIAVAPMFTIVSRGPLGGMVLTAALPVLIYTVHLVLNEGRTLLASLYVAAAVSAVVLWRLVMRLEAVDGGMEIGWRAGSSAAAAESRPSPLVALVSKELHLQQLTFVVAGLSFFMVLVAHWMQGLLPPEWMRLAYPFSLLHLVLVPVIAGSLAAAEERRLGTLESQVLQPMATWKQWTVKAAVTLAVSIALGVGLLAIFSALDPSADVAGLRGRDLRFGASALLESALVLASLYISSLSSSGVRAVIASIAVILGVGAAGPVVGFALVAAPARAIASIVAPALALRLPLAYTWPVPAAVAAGTIALLLRLGLTNYRSAERSSTRLWRQSALIVVLLAVGGTLSGVVQAVASASAVASRLTPSERLALSASATRHARWRHALDGLSTASLGRVGVCLGDGLNEACLDRSARFPMQSVMKLPVAIAALEAVDEGRWHLDDRVLVTKKDLSVFVQPLATLVGSRGYETTIDDLIRRAIVDSDSAATDILIGRLGGPVAVQTLLQRKAVTNVHVDRDERHLQTDILGLTWRDEFVDAAALNRAIAAVPESRRDAAFEAYLRDERDTATPFGMVVLLEQLTAGKLLSPALTTHLLEILRETTTFPDRLKAGVPEGWTIGHKTGTSGDWKGVTAATNDVGIITGQNDETICVAVFIAESRAPEAERAAFMASVARLAVDGYK